MRTVMQYKFHVFVFLSVAAYWLHCFCLVNLCSKQPYILLFDSMIQLILKIVFWLYYSLVRQFVVDKHLTRRLCTFNHVTGLCTLHHWVDSSHLPLSLSTCELVITKNLCLPGLTDKMRNDYVIMRALHDHTRLTPEQRETRLSGFVAKMQK